MEDLSWLQLFAEGGEGGAAAPAEGAAGQTESAPDAAESSPAEEAPGGGSEDEEEAAWRRFLDRPGNQRRLERLLNERESERAAREEETARLRREESLRRHYYGLRREAERLREVFPDFELERELQDPEFLRRTLPESGMSLEDAFYSLHHAAILQRQAEAIALRSRADAAAALRAGQRPRENGSSAAATALGAPDLQHMSRRDRLAYIRSKYPANRG